MKRPSVLGLLVCGLLALVGCGKKSDSDGTDGGGGGGGTPDPTEYTIALRTPGEGSTVRGLVNYERTIWRDSRDAAGKSRANSTNQTAKEETGFIETIGAFPDGAKKATKARVKIDKWWRDRAGSVKPELAPRVIGSEVTVELRKDGYAIGPCDGALVAFLRKRYQNPDEEFDARDFLPEKPLKTGVPWDVPILPLLSSFPGVPSFGYNSKKPTTAAGELVRVEERAGRKYGRIRLKASVTPGAIMVGDTLKEGRFDVEWVIDACIDGTRHDIRAWGTVDFLLDIVEREGGTLKMTIKGTLAVNETEETIGAAATPAPRPKKEKPAPPATVPPK
jgi:hypothetical protein